MDSESSNNEELEMPLSPVLSCSRAPRKSRGNKKRGDPRKVVDEFGKEKSQPANCFLDDSLTVSQAECISKLEKLGQAKQENHETKQVTEGFKTAAGRTIEVSNEMIKSHALLFQDILSGSDKLMDKKYSFLTKTERYRKPEVKPDGFKDLHETEVIECENEVVVNTETFLVDRNSENLNLDKNLQSFVECSTIGNTRNDVFGSQKNQKRGIFSREHCDDLQGFVKPSVPKSKDLVLKTSKPLQKGKQFFSNENFDDLLLDSELQGFVKGSAVAMTDKRKKIAGPSLKKKNEIFANENFDDLVLDKQFQGFAKCSSALKMNKGRGACKPSQNTISKVFGNENFSDLVMDKQFQGFVKPSVNSGSATEKKCVLFANENFDDIDLNAEFNGFTKSSSIILEKKENNSDALTFSNNPIFDGISKLGDIGELKKKSENKFKGFDEHDMAASQAKSRTFSIQVDAYVSNLLHSKEQNSKRRLSFKGDSSPAVKKSKHEEYQAEKPVFLSEGSLSNIKGGLLEECSASSPGFSIKQEKPVSSSAPSTAKKKRLGISHCKPIQISKEKLARARLIFDDVENIVSSPVKSAPLPQTLLCSTPMRNTKSNILLNSTLTPIRNQGVKNTICGLNTSATPIKDTSDMSYHPTYSTITFMDESKTVDFDKNSCFVLQQPSNVKLRDLDLEEKRIYLKNELKLIIEKQEALRQQNMLLEMDDGSYRRKRTGVLSAKKLENGRVNLKTLRFNTISCGFSNVTSQNADLYHFSGVNTPSITTADGAIIIPNLCNLVGLSEIEIGFRTMPGIEVKLIPPRWIKNHYKWIIWKLASYERTLPDLKECLTIENVVQQLKYRYDKEIDGAERSILRKIFEKDDASQKRMVLCVSDVITLGDKLELELTDGWYGIRTVIDEPLCDQIARGKIKVGTKLMICGAELLNCDGCHPLDAPDSVRLKINCNSTRRTKWHVKLGQYHSNLEPFPISLHSVFPMGGTIGCIKVFVARVYPIKYIEKQGNLSVWRNRKAEERRAADWENEKIKSIEDVREAIMKDYETITKSRKSRSFSKNEIKEIACPETLYDYYEQCDDPDSLSEILTESQIRSIKDYAVNLKLQKEREMNSKLRDRLVNVTQRDVTSVLSLLIVDAVTCANSGFIFHIWRPTETHMQIIQEGCVYNIYNVSPKRNGDLCTTSRTKFRAEQAQTTAFDKFKRIVLEISRTCEHDNKLLSNEFDTVGIVVQTTINNFNQNLWLCDSDGKLLFVKIYEGPKSCLLLDHLKSGHVVAVSNLRLCETKHDFGQAIANHFTIISSYPQPKHLQEAIENFLNVLSSKDSKDIDILVKECNENISYYMDKIDVMKSKSNSSSFLGTASSSHTSSVFNESCEESTLVYSRITSTDVAMSMIDIDKYT